MNTDQNQIVVSGMKVEIVRKDIKNLHLGVYPPNGRVRVAVPLRVSDNAVRLAVISKLGWIKRQKEKFEAQPRQSEREMLTGESHYYLGSRYRMQIINNAPENKVVIRSGSRKLELHCRGERGSEQLDQILQNWYREKIKEIIPKLLKTWGPKLKVRVPAWGVRKMKTRWGSCNPVAGRILLNLELIKTPVDCLEYIVVHELLHLIERRHNDKFVALMDKHLPNWRLLRKELNQSPLGHATWDY